MINQYNPHTQWYRLINIEQFGRKISMVVRDQNLERHVFNITDFYPYCYIKSTSRIPLKIMRKVHDRQIGDWRNLYNEPMDKVVFKNPADVRALRESLELHETGEADVIYTTRFLAEVKIRNGYFVLTRPPKKNGDLQSYKDIIPIGVMNIPTRNIHFDIEAVDNITVLVGLWDSYTNKYFSSGWAPKIHESSHDTFLSLTKTKKGKSRRKLEIKRDVLLFSHPKPALHSFFEYMHKMQPDVVAGWYIKGYDIPQLFIDADKVDVDVNKLSPFNSAPDPEKIKGLVQIDLLEGFKKLESSEIRSYKLPNVIKSEFGIGVPSDPKRIPEMWVKGMPLVDYNSSHVDACKYLDEQLGIIEFIYQLAYTCCCRFDDTDSMMRLIDALILSSKDQYTVYPNKPQYGDDSEIARGATVLEPVPDVVTDYELVIDASKLYPSIIISMNLGIDTLDVNGNIKIPLKEDPLFLWDRNIDESSLSSLFKYLQTSFDIKIDKKPFIYLNEKKTIIHIKYKTNEIIIKLSKSKKKATIKLNGEYICKIGIEYDKFKEKTFAYINELGSVYDTIYFSDSKKCELSKAFDFLFNLRKTHENKRDELLKNEGANRELISLVKKQIFAVKIPTNGIYGLIGNSAFRLYNKTVQECVTQVGRDFIQFIMDMVGKYCDKHDIEYDIKAGDTDSTHAAIIEAETLDEAIEMGEKITKFINKKCDTFVARYGIKPGKHRFIVDLEAISESALYKAKKRYAMKFVWEDGVKLSKPKYKIVGLEPKRSDNPEITEKVLKRVIHMTLDGESSKKIRKYADKQYKKVLSKELTAFEIGIPKGMKQDFAYYFRGECRIKTGGCGKVFAGKMPFTKEWGSRPNMCPMCENKISYGRPIHAYAAAFSNLYLGTKFVPGDKVRYLYVKEHPEVDFFEFFEKDNTKEKPKFPSTHVIAIDENTELPEGIEIDYEKQNSKILTEKIEPLLEIIEQ